MSVHMSKSSSIFNELLIFLILHAKIKLCIAFARFAKPTSNNNIMVLD